MSKHGVKPVHPVLLEKQPLPNLKQYLNLLVSSPMQLVAVDLLRAFPKSHTESTYLLVAIDYFTKWGKAYLVPNEGLHHCSHTLQKCFSVFLNPKDYTPIKGSNLIANS